MRESSTVTGPGSTEQVTSVPELVLWLLIGKGKSIFHFTNPVNCGTWDDQMQPLVSVIVTKDASKSLHLGGRLLLISDHSATLCFPEEVMLAEENKNSGPSALDGEKF